jgi:hypothetical protein
MAVHAVKHAVKVCLEPVVNVWVVELDSDGLGSFHDYLLDFNGILPLLLYYCRSSLADHTD